MEEAVIADRDRREQDERIVKTMERERSRLSKFIRARVPDPIEVEDVLQEVFYEFVAAQRLVKPIEQVSAWLFQVARNRITDLFRKARSEQLKDCIDPEQGDDLRPLTDLLPSAEDGPAEAYARSILLEEIEKAIAELPEDQRDVFIAHELHGVSFKQLAAETGLSVNTLLSRKRYAVLRLRQRLQAIYDEVTG
jgi:RNA polymerase sigma factor (sigma-70 family)